MASKQTLSLTNIRTLEIASWDKDNQTFYQVQVEANNGRRFILTNLRTSKRELCEKAIEIIKKDKYVKLKEFTEVMPNINSNAYILMKQKGLLKDLN